MTCSKMHGRYDSNPNIKGTNYEQYVTNLVSRNATVKCHPSIGGKTPDLLAIDQQKQECIIECTTLNQSLNCEHMQHAFTKDPAKLNERLYDSLERKMRKYGKGMIGQRAFVVAIQNECCGFFDKSVQDVVMGAWRFRQGNLVNLWEAEEYAYGLFGLYPHCSGILHSTWTDHLYFPNPRSITPANLDLFPFASIADPAPQTSGQLRVIRQPTDTPSDAPLQKIRGATIHGLPPGNVPMDTVAKVVGKDEEGRPIIEIVGYELSLLR